MLTLGIPSFRLEKDVVEAEIDILRQMGVQFAQQAWKSVKDVTLDELRNQGYAAFYVAIGAQGGRKAGVDGEERNGCACGRGVPPPRERGRNDPARQSERSSSAAATWRSTWLVQPSVRAAKSTFSALNPARSCPPRTDEIEEAEAEGVRIHHERRARNACWSKTAVKSLSVEFKACTRVFDADGRFSPAVRRNRPHDAPNADSVLMTIGQSILWGGLLAGTTAQTNRSGTLQADGFTYQSAQPDVFTGGDCFTGPKFAIDAIAAGKQGAISIHRFVHPGQSLTIGRDRREYVELDKKSAVIDDYDHTPRQKPETLDEKTPPKSTFSDLRGTFTLEQVQKETARCLGCGVTLVDSYMCVGCGQCTTKCKFDAIRLVRRYDGAGVEFTHIKPVVVKQVLLRKGKIAIKKVKRALGAK